MLKGLWRATSKSWNVYYTALLCLRKFFECWTMWYKPGQTRLFPKEHIFFFIMFQVWVEIQNDFIVKRTRNASIFIFTANMGPKYTLMETFKFCICRKQKMGRSQQFLLILNTQSHPGKFNIQQVALWRVWWKTGPITVAKFAKRKRNINMHKIKLFSPFSLTFLV